MYLIRITKIPMKKSIETILAIETSCDDTSAAVLRDGRVDSLVISSQLEHNTWGGVVPELASRSHLVSMAPIIRQAMTEATAEFAELTAIAVTSEPGLVGSLLVGLNTAKGLAVGLNIPLVAVHHIEAHLLSVLLDNTDVAFPYLALVVSGGHTLLYHVEEVGAYNLVGATRDDAAGEAFDKGAKLLGLGYPGGPIIDELARDGNPTFHKFPRGSVEGDDFSFSGLKTSLRYYLRDNYPDASPTGKPLADICASYQEAIVDALVAKTMKAAERHGLDRVAVVGGVAANSRLRQRISDACAASNRTFYSVKPIHGTDNAAMIGIAGWHKLNKGEVSPLTVTARANMIRATKK